MVQALILGGFLALIGGAIYLMWNPTRRNNSPNDNSSGPDHGTGFSGADNAIFSDSGSGGSSGGSSDSGGGGDGGDGSSE